MAVAFPDDGGPPPAPTPITPFPRRPMPGALPSPPTALIGRADERAAVAALLADPDVRLVTLVGPGGVGKTRLAIAAAASVAAAFPDGVAFVDLAPVADPELVGPTIARALGVRESGERPPRDDLLAFLRERELLLVLDNMEHVLAAAPLASALLAACPDATLLATSRVRLRLAGEHAYPVAPLALPTGTSPTEVSEAAAVRLFVARARAAAPGFALTEGNAGAVAAICRRLDGLPLAIELAASRSALFPPATLLNRLERRLPMALVGPLDAPARQRTLHDAIAWSHDLLSPDERVLLRRLAVFAGGATVEAAELVAGGRAGEAAGAEPGEDADGVRDVVAGLASLVDQGLVRAVAAEAGVGADDEPRFVLLETIRAFALDRLAASGEEAAIRRRHAANCLALVEQAEPALWREPPNPWLDRLAAEGDNLRAALAWALDADPETALRLAGGLWQFWERRDLRVEARSWLERALERAGATGAPPAVRARALAAAGSIAVFQDDHAAATAWLEEAVAAWRALGDRVELARTLLHLGETIHRQGDPERALAIWEEALPLFRPGEDARGIAEVHNLMGFAAFDLQRFDRAEALFGRALALVRGAGDRAFEAQQLMNLGVVAGMQGDWPRAAAMCEEALAAFRSIGAKVGMGYALLNLGDCVLRQGDARRALALLQESLALTLEIDNREGVFFALEGLAPAALALGHPQQAARFLGAADGLRAAHGVPPTPLDLADRAARLSGPLSAALGEAGLAAALAAAGAAPYELIAADALAFAPADEAGRAPSPEATLAARLTPREMEVVRLLIEGRTDKEIAATLGIGRPTASKHVEAARAKFGAPSRSAVVAAAVRAGLG